MKQIFTSQLAKLVSFKIMTPAIGILFSRILLRNVSKGIQFEKRRQNSLIKARNNYDIILANSILRKTMYDRRIWIQVLKTNTKNKLHNFLSFLIKHKTLIEPAMYTSLAFSQLLCGNYLSFLGYFIVSTHSGLSSYYSKKVLSLEDVLTLLNNYNNETKVKGKKPTIVRQFTINLSPLVKQFSIKIKDNKLWQIKTDKYEFNTEDNDDIKPIAVKIKVKDNHIESVKLSEYECESLEIRPSQMKIKIK